MDYLQDLCPNAAGIAVSRSFVRIRIRTPRKVWSCASNFQIKIVDSGDPT